MWACANSDSLKSVEIDKVTTYKIKKKETDFYYFFLNN